MWFRFNDRLTQVDGFQITVEWNYEAEAGCGMYDTYPLYAYKAGREMLVSYFHTKEEAYDALNYIEILINSCLNNSNQGYVIDLDFEDD